MVSLTFGEQVKIVLSRKGMTIKELAEQIEERTGKKMSRQNLTQRLGRDNFQEQDMRMIAEILGCSFQLSILATAEAERAMVIEEELPSEKELHKLAAKKEMKQAKAQAKEEARRDITVGKVVDGIMAEETAVEEIVPEEIVAVENTPEEIVPEEAVPEEVVAAEIQVEEVTSEEQGPAITVEQSRPAYQPSARKEPKFQNKMREFIPIKKRKDEDENLEVGEINPYTGHEYQTNSVRTHPKRIGYVQVYDRKEHKWDEMTEWAFIGLQEQKKKELGKDYQEPIFLD